MNGWYVGRGLFAIPLLVGEKAMVERDEHSTGFWVQFNNRELPIQFTHGCVPMNQTVILVEREMREDGRIVLEFMGKKFTRSVRNGKFVFRNLECRL